VGCGREGCRKRSVKVMSLLRPLGFGGGRVPGKGLPGKREGYAWLGWEKEGVVVLEEGGFLSTRPSIVVEQSGWLEGRGRIVLFERFTRVCQRVQKIKVGRSAGPPCDSKPIRMRRRKISSPYPASSQEIIVKPLS